MTVFCLANTRLSCAFTLKKSPFREILQQNFREKSYLTLAAPRGIEPRPSDWESGGLAVILWGQTKIIISWALAFVKHPIRHAIDLSQDQWISVSTNTKICAKSNPWSCPTLLKRDQICEQLQMFDDQYRSRFSYFDTQRWQKGLVLLWKRKSYEYHRKLAPGLIYVINIEPTVLSVWFAGPHAYGDCWQRRWRVWRWLFCPVCVWASGVLLWVFLSWFWFLSR